MRSLWITNASHWVSRLKENSRETRESAELSQKNNGNLITPQVAGLAGSSNQRNVLLVLSLSFLLSPVLTLREFRSVGTETRGDIAYEPRTGRCNHRASFSSYRVLTSRLSFFFVSFFFVVFFASKLRFPRSHQQPRITFAFRRTSSWPRLRDISPGIPWPKNSRDVSLFRRKWILFARFNTFY